MPASPKCTHWGPKSLVVVALGCAAFAWGASCLKATSIDTRAYTEVPCTANASVTVVVGASLEDLSQRMAQGVVSSTQVGCVSPSDGFVGDLVLLPERTGEQIAFAVMTRPDGQPSDQCGAAGHSAGCIVAKRQVAFLTHEQLGLRVDMRLSCLSVTCSVDQTCVAGRCMAASLPAQCPPPCGEQNLPPANGGPPDADAGPSKADAGPPDDGRSDGSSDVAVSDAVVAGDVVEELIPEGDLCDSSVSCKERCCCLPRVGDSMIADNAFCESRSGCSEGDCI